ncbi:MAG: fasciclin domain-containing protein [Bacteroidales bacterium]|nr:fasciclin domain-containing protein [Bacteroidales bacterium]
MRRIKNYALFALAFSLTIGCVEDDKYERPDWLAGKLFTQLSDTAIFSTFAECLKLTGYDTIINTSGSYTIFAPNNDAFELYFQNNPNGYTSVSEIPHENPQDELFEIVKYHIVQNPWSREQLRSVDVWGWIDPADETNDEPKGFKRETLLEDQDIKYGTRIIGNKGEEDIRITDTLDSPWYRRVVTDARKSAPLFYKEYFDIYDLSLNDYYFYFGRSFEDNSDMFYLGAKLKGKEIFAENGFIHNIDRVVSPGKNAYQIIASDYDDRSYDRFLDLVNLFPEFDYNQNETFNQVGAEQGLEVDSLFDLTFPDLAFNVTKERTEAPPGTSGLPGNVTTRYHHGMLAPTNTALTTLENQYMPGGLFWDGISNAPKNVKRIIVNSHLSMNAVYETDLQKGFYNGEDDLVTIEDVSYDDLHKEFGSNASFIGLESPIVPRAFSSVTGPIYLRRGYLKVMYAIEQSGLLSALKRVRPIDQQYQLFVEADQFSSQDSSFLYDAVTESFFCFQISGSSAQRFNFTKNDLRTLLLNHIATREPNGLATREYIPNLAGNYLIFNKETGEVRGTGRTTEGYNGSQYVEIIPENIDQGKANNGSTWGILDWFSFNATPLYLIMQSGFPEFFNLIVDAGLANTALSEFTFTSESENYTVFAPTGAALTAVQADTLPKEDLQKFILAHFIRKQFIFTDGNATPGYYETMRPDESSTELNPVNTNIYIEPNIDEIDFPSGSGGMFTAVPLSDSTNILAGQTLSQGAVTIPVLINNAVIHKLDKALVVSELDTK